MFLGRRPGAAMNAIQGTLLCKLPCHQPGLETFLLTIPALPVLVIVLLSLLIIMLVILYVIFHIFFPLYCRFATKPLGRVLGKIG